MGGQIAQTGATTSDLVGALAQHMGQPQTGRDAALLRALQQIQTTVVAKYTWRTRGKSMCRTTPDQ